MGQEGNFLRCKSDRAILAPCIKIRRHFVNVTPLQTPNALFTGLFSLVLCFIFRI